MKPHKLPLKEFKYIYSKVPRLTVDLVIIDKKRVLLSKRDISPDLGWWHFPGGTVLMNETLKDTVERVALEELNTKIEIIKRLGILEYTEGSGLGYPKAIVFLIKPLSKKLVGGEEARTIKYFSHLPEKTLPEVKKFVQREFGIL